MDRVAPSGSDRTQRPVGLVPEDLCIWSSTAGDINAEKGQREMQEAAVGADVVEEACARIALEDVLLGLMRPVEQDGPDGRFLRYDRAEFLDGDTTRCWWVSNTADGGLEVEFTGAAAPLGSQVYLVDHRDGLEAVEVLCHPDSTVDDLRRARALVGAAIR